MKQQVLSEREKIESTLERPLCFSQPRAPRTVEETDLSFLFLVELLTKTLFLCGQMRLVDLSAHSKLSLLVLEPLLAFMRTERMCEVARNGGAETSIAYSLTELGRIRAQDFLAKSQYAGAAPVSLPEYGDQVRRQSIADMKVDREALAGAFEGVVIREAYLSQFGAALNSGRAIFVYGPAGSGKTYIAEHLANVVTENVAVPYAILVENEVIQVHDPYIHGAMENDVGEDLLLDRRRMFDARWMICRRPVVVTGGELTLSMLDLDFDPSARFYQAPPQVKANNGLLVIDDLGRQLAAAQDIMNRWIVPLDRRVDYLALHTGTKFSVPFDVVVVFSTNMSPTQLADEAFLRRLGYKIYIGPLNEDEYRAVARQVCHELKLPHSEQGIDYLLQKHRSDNRPLLACYPRDILHQVRDLAVYEERPLELTHELLDWAWGNYFAHDFAI